MKMVINIQKFSKSNTKCMHFCQLFKHNTDPDLTLDGVPIEVAHEFKFLGALFVSRLFLTPHIKCLVNKCQMPLNLLRIDSHMQWRADRKVLLRLYRSLIRSKIDYRLSLLDYQIYRNWTQFTTNLHLALSASKSSPINSLYA